MRIGGGPDADGVDDSGQKHADGTDRGPGASPAVQPGGANARDRDQARADASDRRDAGPAVSPAQADALARRAAEAMWAGDTASQALGMHIDEVRAGRAVLSMPVRADMVNGLGVAHGGFVFLLADSTFAFACNSFNQRTVAAGAEIHFLAPAFEGDLLTATGEAVHRGGRSGIYDVAVVNQRNERVAVFRGRSATIKGTHVDP